MGNHANATYITDHERDAAACLDRNIVNYITYYAIYGTMF